MHGIPLFRKNVAPSISPVARFSCSNPCWSRSAGYARCRCRKRRLYLHRHRREVDPDPRIRRLRISDSDADRDSDSDPDSEDCLRLTAVFAKRRVCCFAGTKVSGRPGATHTSGRSRHDLVSSTCTGPGDDPTGRQPSAPITAEADFLCLRRYPAGNCRIALPGWTLVAQGQV